MFYSFLSHGLLALPFWGYVVLYLVMTHVTIVGLSVYMHRSQAHRALDLHPIVSHFIRAYLWLTSGMSTRHWVAIHRKHHAACDTADDPHSPQIYGLRKVLLQGAELYRKEAVNAETIARYGKGTPDDWLERNVYARHTTLGVWIMLITDFVLMGAPGITFWALQMMWIPFWAAGFINGVGHFWGYLNFKVKDASRNVFPIGILIAGEELHNNHHTFPNSAKLSIKPWEFDVSWMYIRLLSMVGLARVNRVAPTPHLITPPKPAIDAETLQAVVQCRYHVLAGYLKQVLLPVFDAERRQSSDRKLYQQSKPALLEEVDTVLDEQSQSRLAMLLKNNERLQQVYQLRAKLLTLWEAQTTSSKELLDALQDWCRQAEATGIEVLREFVTTLKRYTYSPAYSPRAAAA